MMASPSADRKVSAAGPVADGRRLQRDSKSDITWQASARASDRKRLYANYAFVGATYQFTAGAAARDLCRHAREAVIEEITTWPDPPG